MSQGRQGQGAPRGMPPISKGALYLLVATSAISLLFQIGTDEIRYEMARWLLATPDSIWREGKLWQIFTSPLVEIEFIGLIFQGFLLWMFLPTLEKWWGTKRFLMFALYTSVVGVTVGTLFGLAIDVAPGPAAFAGGLDPFIFGALVAFGILFSNQPVRFFGVLPMTGKQLAIGISAVALALLFLGKMWVQGGANIAGMAMAAAIAAGKFTPKLWYLKWKQKRIRKKIHIVRDDDEPPTKWMN